MIVLLKIHSFPSREKNISRLLIPRFKGLKYQSKINLIPKYGTVSPIMRPVVRDTNFPHFKMKKTHPDLLAEISEENIFYFNNLRLFYDI
jgi:hypothetical protein